MILVILISFIKYRMKTMEVGNGFLPIGIYLFVPYMLASVLCLIAVRKIQGKEANYICMGISAGVSLVNIIGKANFSVIYEENNLIWWWIAAVYLGVVFGKESRKSICEVEKFV